MMWLARSLGVLGLFGLCVIAAPVMAAPDDGDLLALSAAYFDANQRDEDAAEARIEYRSDKQFWWFKPFGGVMATSDGAAHGFAGVLIDFALFDRFYITPSFAPGLYHDGDGKDLHHTLEFRSQIELSYRFRSGSRLGISFNHISNANLGEDNPGVESAAITYILPLERFFRR